MSRTIQLVKQDGAYRKVVDEIAIDFDLHDIHLIALWSDAERSDEGDVALLTDIWKDSGVDGVNKVIMLVMNMKDRIEHYRLELGNET